MLPTVDIITDYITAITFVFTTGESPRAVEIVNWMIILHLMLAPVFSGYF